MKRFNELSENITEEEYRNNGRFHYSDIAGYIRSGFSNLVKQEKEESESLSFGSVVDCIVTQGLDKFKELYCVEPENALSDNQKLVVKKLIELGYDDISEIAPSVIIDVLDEVGLYKTFKPETKIAKIIENCKDYFDFAVEAKDKITVEFDIYNDAIETANVLLSNKNTEYLFNSDKFADDKDHERFFQLKFNGEYEGIPITAMTDEIFVDHDKKKVYIIDLKTTSAGYEWDFPKSFIKWNYNIQCKLYSYIVKQVMDNDDFYKDYTLEGFIFVYISRANKNPLIWTIENNLERGDVTIETKNGNKIILDDFVEPLKEMALIKSQQRNVPLDVSEDEPNDILEHIKNF